MLRRDLELFTLATTDVLNTLEMGYAASNIWRVFDVIHMWYGDLQGKWNPGVLC